MPAVVRRIPAWAVMLALVLLAGAALRVDAAVHHGRFLSTDERAYARLAVGLETTGRYAAPGMRDPVHWPPGTPAFFAVARQLGGGADRADLDPPAIYAAQAAVGVALIAVVALLAWLLAGPWAGVLAAAAVALYPPLSRITGDVVSEPLGALTLATAVLLLAWAWRAEERGDGRRAGAPGPWRWWLAGAVLGLCILVRADLLMVPAVLAVLVAAILWRRRGARWALGTAAGVLAAAMLVLAPWAGHVTQLRGGQLTPVTTSSWSSLFVATYLPGDGGMTGLKRELGDEARRHNPRWRDVPDWRLRATWVLDAVAARHPELGRSEALRRETLANLRRYALGDPAGFAGMQTRKVARMWLGYNRGTHIAPRTWILAVHLSFAALGLAGLLWGLWRTRHPMILMILAIVVVGTAVNAFFVAEARHNARFMPLLLAGGAAGLVLSRRPSAARAPAGRSGPPRGSGAAPPRPGAERARAAAGAR